MSGAELYYAATAEPQKGGVRVSFSQIGGGWKTDLLLTMPPDFSEAIKGRHAIIEGGICDPARIVRWLPLPDMKETST